MKSGFIDYVIFTLLLANGLCCTKDKFGGKLYRVETCVGVYMVTKGGRTVFREAVRTMLPLQLDTLSEKLLKERTDKVPPSEGAYFSGCQ